MISIEDLTYKYPDSKTLALDNINLEINEGEFILLVGPSGCGKSTLVHCLNGIIPAVTGGELHGKIWINGKNVSEHKVYQLSTEVGIVFQNPDTQLFGLTVEEDVAFGPENLGIARKEIQVRVKNSMKMAGIEKLKKRFAFTLSGGEKQRTTIAGILAMQPKILILDEPTSDLDPAGTRQVLETVRQLNKDLTTTIILIEHKIDDVFDLAERTIVMDKGRIILDGKTCDVFTHNSCLLERAGIYTPQIIRLSKMLKVKPSYQKILSYLSNLNGSSFNDQLEVSPLIKGSPCVVFENVWFGYRNGIQALKGINLSISRGEFIALIGENGSGKTTLLSCLIGIIRPDRGRILVDKHDIRNLAVSELAQKVGYLFQNPDYQLFADTVYEEVAFGLKNRSLAPHEIDSRVSQSLEMMELSEYQNRHPHSLSRGQRQRLAVASILSLEPDILVLDEPTTGQDRRHVNRFLYLMNKFKKAGKTIILITHDMNVVVEHAERTIVMEKGEIVLDGPTRDVFSRQEILEKSSLEPPIVTKLSYELRSKKGKKTPIVLSVEELYHLTKSPL